MDYVANHMQLTLYQPMMQIRVMSSHEPIIIYMVGLILGVNSLYRLVSFFKLFPMVGKGLRATAQPMIYEGSVANKDMECISRI